MRELMVTTFLTLDGVMQAPGGPGEDDEGGFAHGGWSVNYWDEQATEVMDETTSKPFAMVLGRRTYDIMAAYWPNAPEEGRPFNEATKYVASRGRPAMDWSNSVLIEGDAAEGLAKLKEAYVRWLADPAATTDEPVEQVGTWDELDAYRLRVRGHARAYLDSLDDRSLATPREMNVDGEALVYSPADIFVHTMLHERQHHGDLNTLLYQLGVEVPLVEYRFSLPDRGAQASNS